MKVKMVALVLCLAGICLGVSDLERPQIEAFGKSTLTGVKAVSLAVNLPGFRDAPDSLMLSEATLRTKAELILRRNGIGILDKGTPDSSHLSVLVLATKIPNVPAYALSIDVELVDLVTVPRDTGLVLTRAVVWPFLLSCTPSVVHENGLREYVTESVTTRLEMFCNDYLAANPRPPAAGMFHDLQRESRTVDSPATQKDAEIPFTPIDGSPPEESPPLPPGFALDDDPNEAERAFTAEDLDAMERTERASRDGKTQSVRF